MNGERFTATIGRNARHRAEDAIAQKQIGEPDYVGAYNVGKYDDGVPSVVRPRNLGNCDTLLQGFHADDADPP